MRLNYRSAKGGPIADCRTFAATLATDELAAIMWRSLRDLFSGATSLEWDPGTESQSSPPPPPVQVPPRSSVQPTSPPTDRVEGIARKSVYRQPGSASFSTRPVPARVSFAEVNNAPRP